MTTSKPTAQDQANVQAIKALNESSEPLKGLHPKALAKVVKDLNLKP